VISPVIVSRAALVAAVLVGFAAATSAPALQIAPKSERFGALTIDDPTQGLDVSTMALTSLPATDALRAGWEKFRAAGNAAFSIHLDRRSGAPLLVQGKGLPWPATGDVAIALSERSLREFIAANRSLLLADDAELVLDRDASGELADGVWQVVFGRAIGGVPVAGERYLFTIAHGNLISFGTPRWTRIDANPVPDIDALEARARLAAYMGLPGADSAQTIGAPVLQLIPLRAEAKKAAAAGRYTGAVGAGYLSALVWRVALRVASEPGTWVGLIDAHTGAVRSFGDDNRYARVKGGVYPISDDQNCPDGCEQPGYVMPYANVSINAANQYANTLGIFNCTPGGATATTTLAGQYVRVLDQCGPISQSISCSTDLDLGLAPGNDCAVAAGASAGNTHAARSSFYHLNRIAEHARTWLPTRVWLGNQLTDYVNIDQTCNAYWDGSAVNFFKSGGNCNNTGEIAGVFLHEWGHGLDQNDGGDFDNPSESYADVTSMMATHVSCVGRGFYKSGVCSGYGDTCLNCTGIRDQDWDKHQSHTPATPAGYVLNHCPGGDGPCGGEVHCEAHVSAEAMWDLAARDLPAMGLDPASAWQLADKLWYKSRLGSGGDAYNCALPDSDGCSANSWFEKLLLVDDDDANPSNGTPHAAAIFAAFDRHAIACGTASDPGNQNSTTCPAIGTPTLSATAGSASVALSWTPAANSIGYRILRNDAGCQAGTTRLSLLTGTTFTDTGLINGVPLYYNIQAVASNGACDGPMSNCQAVTPQSPAGSLKLDASTYPCTGQVQLTVTDSNIGADTTTATLLSTFEPQTETVTLSRIVPGSATYTGSMALTASAPVHDGVLSVQNGSTITARYVDANDGAGHSNLQRVVTAAATCTVSPVGAKPVPDGSFGAAMTASRADAPGATIALTWDVATCVSPDNHLLYGNLQSVSSLTAQGAVCDLGTAGSATWSGVPAGDLWYVVVGDDNSATEGSWGTDGTGAQRGGAGASGFCGLTARDNSGVCP
jgi:trimeric autotransporter adhesin